MDAERLNKLQKHSVLLALNGSNRRGRRKVSILCWSVVHSLLVSSLKGCNLIGCRRRKILALYQGLHGSTFCWEWMEVCLEESCAWT